MPGVISAMIGIREKLKVIFKILVLIDEIFNIRYWNWNEEENNNSLHLITVLIWEKQYYPGG